MNEQQILALYEMGSEKAIEETAVAYGRYCYKIAYGILKNGQDAEECINDMLFSCWKRIPACPPKYLRSYIAATTRNLAISRYRQKKGWNEAKEPPELNLVSVSNTEHTNLEETLCNQTVILDCIQIMLQHQTEENRQIFRQKYIQQLDIETISNHMQLSPGCVKTRLFRMRGALKQLLHQNGISTA